MIDPELHDDVVRWSRAAGLAEAGEPLRVDALGGGVSNDVLVAQAPGAGRRWVLKRALGKLRVEADWRSDVRRIHREAACQRWLADTLAPGEVPRVLWEDEDEHVLIMEHAPEQALNWKSEMLTGRVPPEAAARAGDMLGRIHAAARADRGLRAAFGDKTVFDELRLDPYLRALLPLYPALRSDLARLIDELSRGDDTLVHGDYSPKNILLVDDRNILLDHEVAHWGDGRFDLGFLFTHLFLKPLHMAQAADGLWLQVPACWDAYRAAGEPPFAEADWLPLLGAILLARVDGKSPAEYLTEREQRRVRAFAPRLVDGSIDRLDDAVAAAREAWGREHD